MGKLQFEQDKKVVGKPVWRLEWGFQCRFCARLDLRPLEHPVCAKCLFGPRTHFFSKDKAEFLRDNWEFFNWKI